MKRLPTRLDGPVLIEPAVFPDSRGFFQETYRRDAYAELGVDVDFVQDNHSRSSRGVVRGMHFQIGTGQAKLVRCARGAILDVIVDIRRESPTFGQWEAFELDDERLLQIFVPVGFAHGFCVTSEIADVVYKCSSYYDGDLERGFRYDDPDIRIEWPEDVELHPSARDTEAPLLSDVAAELSF
ncbi:MAG TPA: dTDP-4-dehydrorhamnose 3,5-epimerase [Thermoleophilaceae bacterium]|nr:dTDP-4-dehydrorhamnose 3,5-epimerase [Thermoleophilaceae bacterium]